MTGRLIRIWRSKWMGYALNAVIGMAIAGAILTTYPALIYRYVPITSMGDCYTLEGFSMDTTFTVMTYNEDTPAGVDLDTAVKNAINEWNRHTSFPLFTFGDKSNSHQIPVYFTDDTRSSYPSDNWLGLAPMTWSFKEGEERGHLVGGLVLLHLHTYYTWSNSPWWPWESDVQSVVTHELGHILGLGHTTCTVNTMAPVSGGDVEGRTIEEGDIRGLQVLYGK